MEQSKTLNRLAESADLVKMVEDLLATDRIDRVQSILSGIKVTLRNVRETILDTHDAFARDVIARAKLENQNGVAMRSARLTEADSNEATRNPIIKRDLRTTLEKVSN